VTGSLRIAAATVTIRTELNARHGVMGDREVSDQARDAGVVRAGTAAAGAARDSEGGLRCV